MQHSDPLIEGILKNLERIAEENKQLKRRIAELEKARTRAFELPEKIFDD
jgi:cell division septum initiation protein DivIVA